MPGEGLLQTWHCVGGHFDPTDALPSKDCGPSCVCKVFVKRLLEERCLVLSQRESLGGEVGLGVER